MRAAIFDLDGTLVDSLIDIAQIMNETLADAGLPTHAIDAYRTFVGSGITALVERATTGLDADATSLVSAFGERYRADPVRATRPYDGISLMLAELSERGVVLAILSNKPHGLTTAITAELFAEVPFAEIWGHKQAYPRKPDPTSAHEVLRRLSLTPSECAFIGDTDIDMRTGVTCGMRAIGVSWGFRPASELAAAGATCILQRPADLLDIMAA